MASWDKSELHAAYRSKFMHAFRVQYHAGSEQSLSCMSALNLLIILFNIPARGICTSRAKLSLAGLILSSDEDI